MPDIFFPTARRVCASALAIALASSLAWTATAESTRDAVTPAAKARFEAGVRYLRGQDPDRYAQAYREFKAAYAESPTWKILGNLGIAARKLERHGEAIDALEQYLERGKAELSPKEAGQVRRDLAVLASERATMTLDVGQGAFWVRDTRVTDGAPVVNEYGPFDGSAELHVRAGKHEVQIERSGAVATTWAVTLLPGDAATNSFELDSPLVTEFTEGSVTLPAGDETPEDAPPAGTRVGPYVLWGTAAVGGVVTAVSLLQAAEVQSDADDEFRSTCPVGAIQPEGPCGRTTPGDEKAANWRTVAFVAGFASVGALISGTAWYLVGAGKSGGSTTEESSREAHVVRPWVGVRTVGLEGTF